MLVASFDPVITPQARLLVLGSMPSRRSLDAGQYYAHPRNRFWRLMAELFDVQADQPYRDRVRALNVAGIALWDVLESCRRDGSLDADIERPSEVPNDFHGLLALYPSIVAIAFNGQKAARTFERRVAPTLPSNLMGGLSLHALPSTSPANAAVSWSSIVQKWRVLTMYRDRDA